MITKEKLAFTKMKPLYELHKWHGVERRSSLHTLNFPTPLVVGQEEDEAEDDWEDDWEEWIADD